MYIRQKLPCFWNSFYLFLTCLKALGVSNRTVPASPCCSPSQLTSTELLVNTRPDLPYHVGDNPVENLEVITIPDLLVTHCSCN